VLLGSAPPRGYTGSIFEVLMKLAVPALVLSLAAALSAPAAAGEVKLQLANGRVTLQARDASVREILAEWARLGQVKIINADKIAGPPLTLDLQGVPENQALNTVLRSVSGYVAAPRSAGVGASMYDRIVVMSAPRAATTSAYTQPTAQPQYPYRGGMPPGMGNPQPQMMDDQDQPVGPPPTYPGAPPPQPRAVPGQPGAPAPGQLPTGAAGTVSPMPTAPGAPGGQAMPTGPGAPGAVTTPPKRPGGPGGPGGDGGDGGQGGEVER
jgi:hypothetical protein